MPGSIQRVLPGSLPRLRPDRSAVGEGEFENVQPDVVAPGVNGVRDGRCGGVKVSIARFKAAT